MRQLYNRYQAYFPAAFFILGFLFDLLTTDRIDQLFSLVQQAIYLGLIMLFVYWEVLTPKAFLQEDRFLGKLWAWHVELLHFLFGSLLSLYTIFYFKSASLTTSFAFMVFLAILLVINEFPQFQKKGVMIRSALLALCLSSYFIYLVPVLTGSIGVFSFVIAMSTSMAIFYLLGTRIHRKKQDLNWSRRNLLAPGLIVQTVLVVLYFLKALPPVPVSLDHIGIYHQVERSGEEFILKYNRPWWRFWQSGAQTFFYRDGDRIHCFVQVFSPTDFKDEMKISWLKREKGKWEQRDQIPLTVRGGRNQGYRGMAYKSNYEDGDWQVRIMTSDDREVGRINLEVQPDPSSAPREWEQEMR